MKAYLILNDDAGSLAARETGITPEDVRDALVAVGVEVILERVTPPTLEATLRQVVARKPDAVIVGGGDGTISTAAGHLVDTGVPLGVLPLGTFNHFAKDLGISANWKEAVSTIAGGRVETVDVAEVNGRVFINNCSLGAYPEAVREREALRKSTGRGKVFAMLLASFFVFRRLRRMRLILEFHGTSTTLRAPFVLVANNEYCGNLLDVSLRERLDAGLLWLYTTRTRRRVRLLRLMWHCLTRRLEEADGLEKKAVSEIVINSLDGEIPLAIDGEPSDLEPPLRFRIRPRALHVLAPARSA